VSEIIYIISGFFVGTVVGLTGVGGGSLMTPILIFFLGIKPHLAVGTDLLFAAGTKFSGTLKLSRNKVVDWSIVACLIAGSLPAALATLYLLARFGSQSALIQKMMMLGLGAALLLTAVATLYKALFRHGGQSGATDLASMNASSANSSCVPRTVLQRGLTVIFGMAIGALVTLTSVGAGAIGVTVLMLLYPTMPLRKIIASDIAYAVPLTLVAGLGHATIGSVDWRMLVLLLIGSIPGIWMGSHLMPKAPERIIRVILGILLLYASTKLLFA
jgi:uncharacterized protein